MPSIRDLVGAIRQREGVDAAVVLGRDGLLIDSQGAPGLDTEGLAALIPAIIGPADELGEAVGRGDARPTVVLETAAALAIVDVLNADAIARACSSAPTPTSASCCSSCAGIASTSPPWSDVSEHRHADARARGGRRAAHRPHHQDEARAGPVPRDARLRRPGGARGAPPRARTSPSCCSTS